MKEIFELKNRDDIKKILEEVEYGTLALCQDNIPYSVPVNFVYYKKAIYFHGSIKGRKLTIIDNNANVSMSIVNDLSLLPSFFSTNEETACPATQFFASIILEGVASLLDDLNDKAEVLEALMQKLQKQGGYKTIKNNPMYEKMLKATSVVKIDIKNLSAKIKCAQHKSSEVQEKIIENLTKRAEKKDLESIEFMNKYID